MCWDNAEPGSKSGGEAFESAALYTGNVIKGLGVAVPAHCVLKEEDRGDVPSRTLE